MFSESIASVKTLSKETEITPANAYNTIFSLNLVKSVFESNIHEQPNKVHASDKHFLKKLLWTDRIMRRWTTVTLELQIDALFTLQEA